MSIFLSAITVAKHIVAASLVLASFTFNSTDVFLTKQGDLIQFNPPADFVRTQALGSGNIAEYWNLNETMFIYLWLDTHSNNELPVYDSSWQTEYQLQSNPNVIVHKTLLFPSTPQPGGTPIAYCYYPASNGMLTVAIFSATGTNQHVEIDKICSSIRFRRAMH